MCTQKVQQTYWAHSHLVGLKMKTWKMKIMWTKFPDFFQIFSFPLIFNKILNSSTFPWLQKHLIIFPDFPKLYEPYYIILIPKIYQSRKWEEYRVISLISHANLHWELFPTVLHLILNASYLKNRKALEQAEAQQTTNLGKTVDKHIQLQTPIIQN